MSGELDDPNRQAVGLDPAWVEGTGGSTPGEAPANGLEAMTKAQLVEYAAEHSIEVDPAATKADIVATIKAAEA